MMINCVCLRKGYYRSNCDDTQEPTIFIVLTIFSFIPFINFMLAFVGVFGGGAWFLYNLIKKE